jgi:hypothetical protein
MLTTIPSPFIPPIVAVTTTKVSLETKFRMHLSDLWLRYGNAWRSNLRASVHTRRSRIPHKVCSNDLGYAILDKLAKNWMKDRVDRSIPKLFGEVAFEVAGALALSRASLKSRTSIKQKIMFDLHNWTTHITSISRRREDA